jgi:cell division septal protein FtsQ
MLGWLKIKRGNRRSGERVYILDVKLRTRQTRAARVRWLALLSTGLLVAGAALLLGWRGGQWLLDRLVYDNEAFAIEVIDVQTDGVIAPQTLRRWAMVKPAENLFALDLTKVKRDLELRPAIEFVAVERILPHTLKISVNEREPIARTQVLEARNGGPLQPVIYDFDQAGFVMKPLEARWRAVPAPTNQVLPQLAGISASEVQPGRQVESPQIRAALGLLCELDRSPMAGMADLRQISLATPEVLEATTVQGARITFAMDHFDLQLRRWRQIYDQFQRWGKAIVWLDLSVSNNLPVRSAPLALTPAPPAPPVKIAKPSHPRKKNV